MESSAAFDVIAGRRENRVYGAPALRPFSRTMSEEEAKRIDPMGRIPGILEPNPSFIGA
ncbi:MAG: hypothetical protein J5485_04955 [Candidatus Methanomethylophilaceae archaeon]|nr:hypothetical protein [Candidatus Methanomethylophilaceae archaeon]